VAAIAVKHTIPLIVDNTFGTPFLFKPFEHGANVIVHSATKFIGGHGTSIGGLIVDGGNFDWLGQVPRLYDAGSRLLGLHPRGKVGQQGYIVKVRLHYLRDFGACMSPFKRLSFPSGHRNTVLPSRAAGSQRAEGCRIPRRPRPSRVGELPWAEIEPVLCAWQKVPAQGAWFHPDLRIKAALSGSSAS